MTVSGPTVAIVGELTNDVIAHEAGGAIVRQPGGGAIYAAVGARIWGASPRVSAVAGSDAPDVELRSLVDVGIDLADLTRIEGPGLGIWLLHEADGSRHQVPTSASPTMAEVDRRRRPFALDGQVEGVHVAPQTTAGQATAIDRARSNRLPFTVDCMVEPYIDVAPYRDGELLAGAAAFLPSEQEVREIWGPVTTTALWRRLRPWGLGSLIVTRGAAGAEVVWEGGAVRVPPVEVSELDSTGAGDAFSGGYLAGWLRTGDAAVSAAWGTVAASYVVETRGPAAALACVSVDERDRRLTDVRERTTTLEADDD